MRQLSSLDTQFLNIESATTAGHVGSVVVVGAAGGWGLAEMRELLTARLHLAPVLRQRLVEVPFGLSRPYWVDDPSFDLDAHLHELALPGAGSDEQLGDTVARLHAHALDRTRPPWELYVITGLAGGRAAVYSKIHHAAVDGVSGAALLAAMFDIRPEPREVPPPAVPFSPDPLPSRVSLLGHGVTSMVADQARLARTVPPALLHLRTATGHLKAPRTPLNTTISAQRRFAFGSVPLSDIKQARQRYGGTVNDIVVALCTSVLRSWLTDHEALPDTPLVAAVPVSVRHRDRKGTQGNEISVMLAELPTQVADPAHRVVATRESLDRAKARFDAVPSTLVHNLAGLLPTNRSAARPLLNLARVGGPPFNLFISNVPGPRVPLWLAGSPVEAVYPVSSVTSFTGALNITVFTHGQTVDFGFIACRERVPDVWKLVRYLDDAVQDLTTSAVLTSGAT